jgi:hypothetical protein
MEDAAKVGDDMSHRRTLPSAAALIVLGLTARGECVSGAVPDPIALVAPYLHARDSHSVGAVVGRATGDAPRPSAAPLPYEGVSVMLLPNAPEVAAELDGIRAHARDSLPRYMEVTADVTDCLAAYERALLTAGGGELIRGEVSDARGLVRLDEIPAGKWLLLAWRTQSHPGKSPKIRREDTAAFHELTVSSGHSVVTYWVMPVVVQAGQTTEFDLNDRNVWLNGVRIETRQVEGGPKTNKRR